MIYEILDKARNKKHPFPKEGIDKLIWFLDWVGAIMLFIFFATMIFCCKQ